MNYSNNIGFTNSIIGTSSNNYGLSSLTTIERFSSN